LTFQNHPRAPAFPVLGARYLIIIEINNHHNVTLDEYPVSPFLG
jgi:hypothetical protein